MDHVLMKGYIFWDITLCSPVKSNQHFGGKCHFHLHVGFFLGLLFSAEDGNEIFL
jgi:hypothetical protein